MPVAAMKEREETHMEELARLGEKAFRSHEEEDDGPDCEKELREVAEQLEAAQQQVCVCVREVRALPVDNTGGCRRSRICSSADPVWGI